MSESEFSKGVSWGCGFLFVLLFVFVIAPIGCVACLGVAANQQQQQQHQQVQQQQR